MARRASTVCVANHICVGFISRAREEKNLKSITDDWLTRMDDNSQARLMACRESFATTCRRYKAMTLTKIGTVKQTSAVPSLRQLSGEGVMIKLSAISSRRPISAIYL